MSQGHLCPNLSQKVPKEVSQMANRNLSSAMLYGGLSVNLNHLKFGPGEAGTSPKFVSMSIFSKSSQLYKNLKCALSLMCVL